MQELNAFEPGGVRENGCSILMAAALYSGGLDRSLHQHGNVRQPADQFAAMGKMSSGREEETQLKKSYTEEQGRLEKRCTSTPTVPAPGCRLR